MSNVFNTVALIGDTVKTRTDKNPYWKKADQLAIDTTRSGS